MDRKKGIYEKYFKRLFDIILSLILLIILSPILFIVAIVIKFDSNGTVFFVQSRPGKNQKLIKVIKFRTMVKNAVKYQKVGVEVTENDNRITSFGKILRRFKIDELPQLINVLKGDMSFVGPRPTLFEYIDKYNNWELERFCVTPGLTGLAQVNGNIYLKREEKSLYDVEYVKNISFIKDIKIIIKTFLIVLFGEKKFKKNKVVKIKEESIKK